MLIKCPIKQIPHEFINLEYTIALVISCRQQIAPSMPKVCKPVIAGGLISRHSQIKRYRENYKKNLNPNSSIPCRKGPKLLLYSIAQSPRRCVEIRVPHSKDIRKWTPFRSLHHQRRKKMRKYRWQHFVFKIYLARCICVVTDDTSFPDTM